MAQNTKRYRRIGALVMVLALLAPMSIGLAGGVAAQQKVTVTLWLGTSRSSECTRDNVVQSFNEQSETVQVEATLQSNLWEATRTALAGGAGPDIVITPGPTNARELTEAGQLLPLDEFAEEYGWGESFLPWALDLGRADGRLYSLPHQLESLILYYNATLFEQKGWQPPKTMEELTRLAEQIDAEGIIPFAHANAEWRPANEWFVGEFLNHVAGPEKVYEALTGVASWDDPQFAEAIQLLNEMQQNGWFMGGLDRYYTATDAETAAALAEGEAAMKIEGTWFLDDTSDYFGEEAGNENDWDRVPVPSATGEAIFDIGIGSTYSINKNAKDPEAVAEFLTYFFSPEVQAQLLTVCAIAPAPVELPSDALTGIDPRQAEVFTAIAEASRTGGYGYTTWTFWPPKTQTYLIENIEKVWADEMTAEEYLQGMQAVFEQEMREGTVPPIPKR